MIRSRLFGVADIYEILLYCIIGSRKSYWNNYIKNTNIIYQKIFVILMLIIFIVKILLKYIQNYIFFILVSRSGVLEL